VVAAIIAVPAVALAVVGQHDLGHLVSTVLGPLAPGGAN
jgi:hypothetical protein